MPWYVIAGKIAVGIVGAGFMSMLISHIGSDIETMRDGGWGLFAIGLFIFGIVLCAIGIGYVVYIPWHF